MRRHLRMVVIMGIALFTGLPAAPSREAEAQPKRGGTLVMLVQPEPPTLASYLSTSGPIGQVTAKCRRPGSVPLRTTARLASEVFVRMRIPISVSGYLGSVDSVAADALHRIKGFGEVAESIVTQGAPTRASGPTLFRLLDVSLVSR